MPFGRKYDIWDSYTWNQLILKYIEQDNVSAGFATLLQTPFGAYYPGPNGPIGDDAAERTSRQAVMPLFLCPSDRGPFGNEMDTLEYGFIRSNYRGCAGTGDMYGNATDTTSGPWGLGIFGVTPGQSFDLTASLSQIGTQTTSIKDGLSNTILFSEGVTPTVTGWGGPIGEIYGNMGGGLFAATLTPNSSAPDQPIGPCPQDQGDPYYNLPCQSLGGAVWWTPSAAGAHAAARSRHIGGVSVAMGDGSIQFIINNIDISVWRALGTRAGGEVVSIP
jgi:hypothetical protein